MRAANLYRGDYWRKVNCCVNILAQENPSLDVDFLNKIQNGGKLFAAFCLFMGISPKNCGLLGGKGNTLKLKKTTKLKNKRTSIATVQGLYRRYATFSDPSNGSHYRLPLKAHKINIV
jgi:hypothetical protein